MSGTTPPGHDYATTANTTATEFRASVNGHKVIPDVTGTPGDWTITIPGGEIECNHGHPGTLVIQANIGGTWETLETVSIEPC